MTHSLFVRLSVHVEKFDYHRTGIGKILYIGVLLKYAEAFEFWSKTDKVTVVCHEDLRKLNILFSYYAIKVQEPFGEARRKLKIVVTDF
jgi:hypothetical protein